MSALLDPAWAELRGRLLRRDWLAIAFLPGGGVGITICNYVSLGQIPVAVVMLVVMMAMAVSAWHLLQFRCPKCGDFWQRDGLAIYFSPAACVHCGQPRDAPLS